MDMAAFFQSVAGLNVADDAARYADRRSHVAIPPSESGYSTGMAEDRESFIVDCLVQAFSDLMKADPDAFRTRFRKMAADPFAFYRGSACVFYADVAAQEGPLGRRPDGPGLASMTPEQIVAAMQD